MSDYSEEDWGKWGEQFGWKYVKAEMPQIRAWFHGPLSDTHIFCIEYWERRAIDHYLSSKDSLIAELTKERDELRSQLASQP